MKAKIGKLLLVVIVLLICTVSLLFTSASNGGGGSGYRSEVSAFNFDLVELRSVYNFCEKFYEQFPA